MTTLHLLHAERDEEGSVTVPFPVLRRSIECRGIEGCKGTGPFFVSLERVHGSIAATTIGGSVFFYSWNVFTLLFFFFPLFVPMHFGAPRCRVIQAQVMMMQRYLFPLGSRAPLHTVTRRRASRPA